MNWINVGVSLSFDRRQLLLVQLQSFQNSSEADQKSPSHRASGGVKLNTFIGT